MSVRLGIFGAVVVALLSVDATSASAAAAPKATQSRCAGTVRWTSDAILTLAIVRHGTIERDAGQCPEAGGFHPAGKKLAAIDRWGRTVGVVENRNDETHGTDFRLVAGSRGVNVYVDAAVPKRVVAEWKPPASERTKALRAVGISAPRDVAFFHGGKRELAVVVDRRSVVVAERTHGEWRLIHREAGTATAPIALRAIVDMNGDGIPEIIIHVSEGRNLLGYDAVLGAKGTRFRRISDNEDTGP
jgi:hypothetical protein